MIEPTRIDKAINFSGSVTNTYLKAIPKSYSELCQISKTELFTEMINNLQSLTISAKRSILDVWPGSEYTSEYFGEVSLESNRWIEKKESVTRNFRLERPCLNAK